MPPPAAPAFEPHDCGGEASQRNCRQARSRTLMPRWPFGARGLLEAVPSAGYDAFGTTGRANEKALKGAGGRRGVFDIKKDFTACRLKKACAQ